MKRLATIATALAASTTLTGWGWDWDWGRRPSIMPLVVERPTIVQERRRLVEVEPSEGVSEFEFSNGFSAESFAAPIPRRVRPCRERLVIERQYRDPRFAPTRRSVCLSR